MLDSNSGPASETTQRRPVLLLIDVEPNARHAGADLGGWDGSHEALRQIQALRPRLEHKTGAPVVFNWFFRFDPQIQKIWGRADCLVEECPQLLRAIEEHGDYCGIHVHVWRWDARRLRWFSELNDPEWTAECLHSSIEGFRKVFHRSPDACPFGDRWLDQNAVALMEAAGIRYDFTIEPGLPDQPLFDDPHATGRQPDYRSAPRVPYQPSRDNFLVPKDAQAGGRSLWMVPLTTTTPAWRLIRRPPYWMKASRSPNLSLSSSYVRPHLLAQLNLQTKVPLAMVLRSGDLATPHFLDNFLKITGPLLEHPGLACCEFTHPATAVARWLAP